MDTSNVQPRITTTDTADMLPNFAALLTDNPLEADEFVYVTYDIERAEEVLRPQASAYRADKTVYVIDDSPELNALFLDLEQFNGVRNDLSKLKSGSRHHFQFKRIDKVVYLSRT